MVTCFQAAHQTFDTPELLEAILLQVPTKTLFRLPLVNKTFYYAIRGSGKLQDKLWTSLACRTLASDPPPPCGAHNPNDGRVRMNPIIYPLLQPFKLDDGNRRSLKVYALTMKPGMTTRKGGIRTPCFEVGIPTEPFKDVRFYHLRGYAPPSSIRTVYKDSSCMAMQFSDSLAPVFVFHQNAALYNMWWAPGTTIGEVLTDLMELDKLIAGMEGEGYAERQADFIARRDMKKVL